MYCNQWCRNYFHISVRNPFSRKPNTCWSLILKRDHLLFSSYENFLLRTQVLFPTFSTPNIRFSLKRLCKILQGTKELQNFIDNCNCALIEHSIVTTIPANKIMEELMVWKHTSHLCWNFFFTKSSTSLVAQTVKCLSTMWETWVQSLCWEDSLEKETATHSSILA